MESNHETYHHPTKQGLFQVCKWKNIDVAPHVLRETERVLGKRMS